MRALILLFLIACSKELPKKITVPVINEPIVDRLETGDLYTNKIDVMVAFLWPAKVMTNEQREAIRGLIRGSRELRNLQDGYFKKKLVLSRAWKEKDCDCVLNSLCGETIPETPFEQCEALETEIFENERDLPAIYEIVEKMKAGVKTSGGEWLKTHSDFPEGPVSELDFERSELRLSVFAPEADPVPYAPINFVIRRSGAYETLAGHFSDQNGRGEWKLDLAVQRTSEALKVQGKLFLHRGNTKREGIIYWMNPVRL